MFSCFWDLLYIYKIVEAKIRFLKKNNHLLQITILDIYILIVKLTIYNQLYTFVHEYVINIMNIYRII